MRKKVLIVDDHKLIFEGLKGQLDDIEMLYARNQKDVDDIIFDEEIPIAVIDISVGRENGFDIAFRIRNHIPAIFFLSMHKSPLFIHKAIDEGYKGYFLKDEPLDTLNDALQNPWGRDFWMSDLVADLVSNEPSDKTELYDRLSPREQQVLRMIAEGTGYKEIGHALNISGKTVNVHRANINRKLGLENSVDIVKYAIKIGLIDL